MFLIRSATSGIADLISKHCGGGSLKPVLRMELNTIRKTCLEKAQNFRRITERTLPDNSKLLLAWSDRNKINIFALAASRFIFLKEKI